MKRTVTLLAALALCACAQEPLPVAPSSQENLTPQAGQPSADPLPAAQDPWLWEEITTQLTGEPVDGSLVAAFEQSKSTLSGKDVVWCAGDSYRMLGYDAEQKAFYTCDATTENGGASATFHYDRDIPQTPCYSVYPTATRHTNNKDYGIVFGIDIPAQQTATPGGISPGANLSYAKTERQADNPHFQNVTALLKFRLTGAAAASVKSVTVRGLNYIAGEGSLLTNGEEPAVLYTRRFSGQVPSRTVTLSGDFLPDTDYYIALAPGAVTGFTMVFTDDQGRHIAKSSQNAVLFKRSTILNIGAVNLGDSFADAPAVDTTPVAYLTATKGSKPFTLAVLPDGFTDVELSDYEILARSALDMLFNTQPYKRYKEYFNVWIMKVASNESGATVTDGKGNAITPVDNYFKSGWGDGYSDMKADTSIVYYYLRNHCPDMLDGSHKKSEVPVLILVNDMRYGGMCHSYGDGGTYCQVPYTFSGGQITWAYPQKSPSSDIDPSCDVIDTPSAVLEAVGKSTGDWRNIVVHEFGGHAIGRLLDEYWYEEDLTSTLVPHHNWAVPMGRNISASYTDPLWKDWMVQDDQGHWTASPAMTAKRGNYGRVGMFQGGQVSVRNRWRSEIVSCMIDNRLYFSAWQRELIARRICEMTGVTFDRESYLAGDVDTADPVRDEEASPVIRGRKEPGPVEMPLLPPPVLEE